MSHPDYVSPLRGHVIWLAINRGELTLGQARTQYVQREGFSAEEIDRLYEALFASFPLKRDTYALMEELETQDYRLFAITDNVNEIVAFLKEEYDFWDKFDVAAVSAEIGVLKPDPRIYQWLIDEADIAPQECVFLDDVEHNVAGAKAVGMDALLFTDADKARADLRALGLNLRAGA